MRRHIGEFIGIDRNIATPIDEEFLDKIKVLFYKRPMMTLEEEEQIDKIYNRLK